MGRGPLKSFPELQLCSNSPPACCFPKKLDPAQSPHFNPWVTMYLSFSLQPCVLGLCLEEQGKDQELLVLLGKLLNVNREPTPHSLALMTLPRRAMKRLQANKQAQRISRTPQNVRCVSRLSSASAANGPLNLLAPDLSGDLVKWLDGQQQVTEGAKGTDLKRHFRGQP